MTSVNTVDSDIAELSRLNADYLASDQNMDVARYEQILAEDFTPRWKNIKPSSPTPAPTPNSRSSNPITWPPTSANRSKPASRSSASS